MESISLIDGLILTFVSILLVFVVLGSIGILTELVSKLVNKNDTTITTSQIEEKESSTNNLNSINPLKINKNNRLAAEMIALVFASEDMPNRKFEVVESKRIK